jgi:hypothetical protein
MRRFWNVACGLLAAAALVSCGGASEDASVSDARNVAPGSLAAIAQLDGNALPAWTVDSSVVADNVHNVYYLAGEPAFLSNSDLRVVRIDANGKVTPVAGPWNNAPAICQQLGGCPTARIATDRSGNLYVFWTAAPPTGVPTIYKLDSSGNVLSTLELKDLVPSYSIGTVSYHYRFGDRGSAPPMAVDRQGNVLIFDGEGALWRIGPDGAAKSLAGQDYFGTPQDGIGSNARFRFSSASITTDDAGNVYVPDGQSIRKVTPAGVVTTIPVSGTMATGTDAGGNIYVVQNSLCSGQTVAPSGELRTIVFKSSNDAVLCQRDTSIAAFAMTPHGVVAVSFDKVVSPLEGGAFVDGAFVPAPPSGALLLFAGF